MRTPNRRKRWLMAIFPDTTTSSWTETKVKLAFLKDLQSKPIRKSYDERINSDKNAHSSG